MKPNIVQGSKTQPVGPTFSPGVLRQSVSRFQFLFPFRPLRVLPTPSFSPLPS